MPILYLLQMVPCVRILFGISINKDHYKLLILTLNVKLATGYRELTETTFFMKFRIWGGFDLVIFYKIFGRLLGLG